ncbi:SMI1/KNR4 family protein [Streptomyces chrestomyceticus]|uniref:SMI1/KNR4 family protein n=1 Tax=Streptomyces chrestomyceticus TaxID=68185 RepID=UPI0019D03582|nr:SMI1/KNR4 family protein [Streptomyces chrestomyceticus]
MNSSVQRLAEVFPPPGGVQDRDWELVESRLGAQLPADYKELIDAYGGGYFDEAIWVLEPDSSNKYYDLLNENEGRMEAVARLWELGEARPAQLESDENRLIAWALTEDGDYLYWLVRPGQDPADWTVMIKEGRGSEWEHHPMSCTEFLASVLVEGNVESEIFDELPEQEHLFQPTSDFD